MEWLWGPDGPPGFVVILFWLVFGPAVLGLVIAALSLLLGGATSASKALSGRAPAPSESRRAPASSARPAREPFASNHLPGKSSTAALAPHLPANHLPGKGAEGGGSSTSRPYDAVLRLVEDRLTTALERLGTDTCIPARQLRGWVDVISLASHEELDEAAEAGLRGNDMITAAASNSIAVTHEATRLAEARGEQPLTSPDGLTDPAALACMLLHQQATLDARAHMWWTEELKAAATQHRAQGLA